MKKKESNLFKNLLIIFLIVVVIMISLVLIDKKSHLPSTFIKNGVYLINNLINPSNDLELENLKAENEKLKIYMIENNELKEEIKKLKEKLELNSLLSDKTLINATVINRNLDYWNETLNLDKGEKEGIKVNMPVTSNGYLVGIISETSKNNSTVNLLNNTKLPVNISVKIKIGDKYVYGILNNYKDGLFEIMGIVENIDIKENTIVETSGLSSHIPSGIGIGKVESVVTDNFDLSKIVKVKPQINFDDIGYVTIIKGES